MKKKYTTQIVAFSNEVEIIAESEEQAKETTHAEHSLQELGTCDTKVNILGEEPTDCKHTRIRFITEEIKKVPEGYDKMQKKMEKDENLDIEDYDREGYFINKTICVDCDKVLATDED